MLACCFVGDLHAQDPQFSQFYANPIYLNPAFAGSHGCPRFAANYRNQWPGLSGQFVTYSVSYDQYFKNISGGFGVIATHDQQGQGTINHTTLSLNLLLPPESKPKVYNAYLEVKATWNQKSLDWDKLTFGDMIDPTKRFYLRNQDDIPRGGNKGFFDASAGFVGFSKNFFLWILSTPFK